MALVGKGMRVIAAAERRNARDAHAYDRKCGAALKTYVMPRDRRSTWRGVAVPGVPARRRERNRRHLARRANGANQANQQARGAHLTPPLARLVLSISQHLVLLRGYNTRLPSRFAVAIEQ